MTGFRPAGHCQAAPVSGMFMLSGSPATSVGGTVLLPLSPTTAPDLSLQPQMPLQPPPGSPGLPPPSRPATIGRATGCRALCFLADGGSPQRRRPTHR